jgi:uncharacterized protein (DUF736 family)
MENKFLQPIGKMTKKSLKNGEFYNLKISIPFMLETEFYVSENGNKNSENSPDFLVFFATNKFGAIWQKVSKKGKKYLYGKIELTKVSSFFPRDLEFSGFLIENQENDYLILAQDEQSSEIVSEHND